jgi:hypothetical protein
MFSRAGGLKVTWVPSCFEVDRLLDTSPEPVTDKIVMIANRSMHRLRPAQSWLERVQFVKLMEKEFGTQFEIYGQGWDGPCAMGSIKFDNQSSIISKSLLTANWDHFSRIPYYFSNRLAFSLAAGSVHATTEHDGFGEFFRLSGKSFLLNARSPKELTNTIRQFMSSPNLHEIASRIRDTGKEFAFRELRQDDMFVRILNHSGADIDLDTARQSWDLSGSTPTSLRVVRPA